MTLEQFRKLVGATSDQRLAKAVGVDRATIYKIRKYGTTPSPQTVLKLLRWANEEARKRRLPVRDRLTFEALVGAKAA